eukprot:6455255-Amphidinium_carterae.2
MSAVQNWQACVLESAWRHPGQWTRVGSGSKWRSRKKAVTVRLADAAEPLNESQRQMVKSVTAKILWLAKQGRPDVVGAAAFLSRVAPDELTMTHLKEA